MFVFSFVVCVWADWCVLLPCSTGAAVLIDDESALTKAHDWPGNLFYEGRLNTYCRLTFSFTRDIG